MIGSGPLGALLIALAPFLLIIGFRNCFFLRRDRSWVVLLWRLCFGAVPVLGSIVLALVILDSVRQQHLQVFAISTTVLAIAGFASGAIAAAIIGRRIEPLVSNYLHRKMIRSGRSDAHTDIREVGAQLPSFGRIDHERRFSAAKAADSIYLGEDSSREPVHVARSIWKKSHVQVMGPPGTGKGVQAGVTLTQALGYGDAVYVFDPKSDEWAPSVYSDACRKAGVPFRYVDLRDGAPQVNPVQDASASEVAEMFYAGLRLGQRGDPSDFYRLDDREAARQVAKLASDGMQSLEELRTRALASIAPDLIGSAKGFFSAFREVAELACIQTRQGVDLKRPLTDGGCIYFVGSLRDEPIVILQKMLFVRLIQLIERKGGARHCSIFLDEFKYLLSQQTVNALGTIRDKGCNILLAHQSLGDFADCGSDLSESSVRTTVLDTTPLKWLYRPTNQETAQWISDQTGQIRIDVERHRMSANPELAELKSTERSASEGVRNLIDVNMVLSLPDRCAVCIGAGTPVLANSAPVQVAKVEMFAEAAQRAEQSRIDLLTRVPESEWPRRGILDESGDAGASDEEASIRLLRFIYDETWTHRDIVRDLLSDTSSEEVDRLLAGMESEKLIRQAPVEASYLPSTSIWGITASGCKAAKQFAGTELERPSFRKTMVNAMTLNHHLDLQRLRLRARESGWRNWMIGDRGQVFGKGVKYPDAIATRPDGVVVAIELERTIKNLDRYPPALIAHLDGRRKGLWDEIYYLCPSEREVDRLKRIFSEVAVATFRGEDVAIGEAHRAPFRFYSYSDDWTDAGS